MATKLTSKGQVTIPKKMRQHLGIGPGTAVDFLLTANGDVVLRPARPAAARQKRVRKAPPNGSAFARIRGSATVRMTTDEIMALTRG